VWRGLGERPDAADAPDAADRLVDHVVTLPQPYVTGSPAIERWGGGTRTRASRARLIAASQMICRELGRAVPTTTVVRERATVHTACVNRPRARITVSRYGARTSAAPAEPIEPVEPQDRIPAENYRKLFWRMGGPLRGSREGEYFDQMAVLSGGAERIAVTMGPPTDSQLDLLFPLGIGAGGARAGPPTVAVNAIAASRALQDADVGSPDQTAKDQVVDIATYFPSVESGAYDAARRETRAMEFLVAHIAEIIAADMTSPIHARLEAIWETLGFSVAQKLDMVVRYTRDPDDTTKLPEALAFWEHAEKVVNRYESAYHAVCDFVQLEVRVTYHTGATLDDLETKLRMCEDKLRNAAQAQTDVR